MKRSHRDTPELRVATALTLMLPLLGWGCRGGEPVASVDPVATVTGTAQTGDSTRSPVESVYGIDEVVAASTRRDTTVPDFVAQDKARLEPMAPETGEPTPGMPGGVTDDPYREGVRLFEDHQYLEAATFLSVAVQEQNRGWYTHYLLGLALWKSGDLDGATGSLERSLELKADFVKTHVNLSRVQNDAGRFDAALTAATSAVALAPHDPVALYLEGRSLANLGRTSEAIERFEESLRLEPGNGDVENHLGLLSLRQGRFAQAVAHLERAVELVPEREYVRNNLGLAYERVGRLRDAQAQFVTGLDIAGESGRLSANLARVRDLPERAVGIARGEDGDQELP